MIGRSWAQEIIKEFGTNDPFKIAQRLGLRIVEEKSGVFGNLQILSEYQPHPPTIILYDNPIDRRRRIAHELFHYLERKRIIKKTKDSEKEASEFEQFLISS